MIMLMYSKIITEWHVIKSQVGNQFSKPVLSHTDSQTLNLKILNEENKKATFFLFRSINVLWFSA